MKSRNEKLARLAQIAELKATIAKGDAAQVLAEMKALSERARQLREDRQAMAAQSPDPATARAHAAWLRQCDQHLRGLRAEEARVRARLEATLETARHEEGRRQALETLKSQAS